jgi:NAD(P)H-flavin reductase
VGPLWYSIASAWKDGEPGVLLLAVGPGTGGDLLATVGPGAELDVTGPLGTFSLPEAPGALLVGVGTGIAPLRAFVEDALRGPSSAPVALVVGARTREDLLWHDELAALSSARAQFHYVPVLSQPTPAWLGRRGYVQQHLAEIAASLPPEFVVRACGSEAMVEGARSVLAELGVPEGRIDTQSYS